MMLPFNKTSFAALKHCIVCFCFCYKEVKDILIQLCIFEQTKQGHVKV